MAMTKSEILASLAETTELTKKDVSKVLEALNNLVYSEAVNELTVPGLGKFVVTERAARKGRNPSTGAEIEIAAKKLVKFKVAKACQDAICG